MGWLRASKFWGDEQGATAIEYGLIAAMVAVVMITGLQVFGNSLNDMYAGSEGSLKTKIDEAGN